MVPRGLLEPPMSFCFKLSESPSSWVLVMSLGLSLGASAQTITVYSAGAVPVGQTRQLTAYVQLSPNSVAWLVNGVPGGSATLERWTPWAATAPQPMCHSPAMW